MLQPKFRITNAIAGDLTRIERARGFLEAARLSDDWIAGMQQRALILEAHYTTHIEGTHLTLDQSERLLSGEKPAGVKADGFWSSYSMYTPWHQEGGKGSRSKIVKFQVRPDPLAK
jgi:hypothetical protein